MFLPVLDRPFGDRGSKEKRVRLDTSTPQIPFEPSSDVDFASINDNQLAGINYNELFRARPGPALGTAFASINAHQLFWHKPTEAELRNQTAKHVAEHLKSLAFFALRLLVLDQRPMDSSSSDDDPASDQILSDSTDTGVETRSNLSDILDEGCCIVPTWRSAGFDLSWEEKDMCKTKPDDCSSVSTANATLGEDVMNANLGEDVLTVGSTDFIHSYPFLSRSYILPIHLTDKRQFIGISYTMLCIIKYTTRETVY